jgi:hypothetical protein
MLAAIGFDCHLVDSCGQQSGLPLGLRRQDLRRPLGC